MSAAGLLPHRRAFLKGAGASALAALAAGAGVGFAKGSGYPIGIQMYAIQSQLVKDFDGTLKALHEIGYRQVEPVGTMGRTPQQFKAALDAAGLAVPSAHILSKAAQVAMMDMATGRLKPDVAWKKIDGAMALSRFDEIMAEMFEQQMVLGNKYLVLAELDFGLWHSKDGIERIIATFKRAGEQCHQRGIKFAWHPHVNDYKVVSGKRGIDWVLGATDPERVFVELDFFWATMAGVDIAALLTQYAGRIHLGHIKDATKGTVIPPGGFNDLNDVPESAFADVGQGMIDYQSLIPLARKTGLKYFFVERDQAPDPLSTARRSYSALSALL